MSLTLLAARPIDFAIFFTMGGLWLFGATFIYFVWRWVIRFERRDGSSFDPYPGNPRHSEALPPAKTAVVARPATGAPVVRPPHTPELASSSAS